MTASVLTTATAAQENWVEPTATQLTCLGQADRDIVTTELKSAGRRTGLDWTARFAAQVSGFALWTGLVWAAVIGAGLWATRIPSVHAPATITATAYLVIAVVAVPVCWRQARRILNHLNRISAEAPRDFLVLYLSALAGAAILFGIVNTSAFNIAAVRHVSPLYYVGEFAAFIVVTALGCVLAYLLLAYAYASALQKPEASQTLNWAGTLAATAVMAWLPAARRSSTPAGDPHLDSGLLRLLGCAVAIDRMGRGQFLPDPRTVRSVILSLELTAATVEQYAVGRVPLSDTATRRRAREDGIRLASVIRSAKAPMARAVHPRNYTAVAVTLGGFLLSWAQAEPGDFTAAITGNTNIGQASPWLRVARRIWTAVLLAAAAVGLPLLPIYNSDHTAAAGLRYALITAAVLALVSPGTPASDIIENAVEDTLPSGASQGSSHLFDGVRQDRVDRPARPVQE
jgi:hypothetical protein